MVYFYFIQTLVLFDILHTISMTYRQSNWLSSLFLELPLFYKFTKHLKLVKSKQILWLILFVFNPIKFAKISCAKFAYHVCASVCVCLCVCVLVCVCVCNAQTLAKLNLFLITSARPGSSKPIWIKWQIVLVALNIFWTA